MELALTLGQGEGCGRTPLLGKWEDFPRFFDPFDLAIEVVGASGDTQTHALGTLSALDDGTVVWEKDEMQVCVWRYDQESGRVLAAPVTVRHSGQIVAVITTTIHGYLKLLVSEGVSHGEVASRTFPQPFKELMDSGFMPRKHENVVLAKLAAPKAAPPSDDGDESQGQVISLSDHRSATTQRTAEVHPELVPQPINDYGLCRRGMIRGLPDAIASAIWNVLHHGDPRLVMAAVIGAIVGIAITLFVG